MNWRAVAVEFKGGVELLFLGHAAELSVVVRALSGWEELSNLREGRISGFYGADVLLGEGGSV